MPLFKLAFMNLSKHFVKYKGFVCAHIKFIFTNYHSVGTFFSSKIDRLYFKRHL